MQPVESTRGWAHRIGREAARDLSGWARQHEQLDVDKRWTILRGALDCLAAWPRMASEPDQPQLRMGHLLALRLVEWAEKEVSAHVERHQGIEPAEVADVIEGARAYLASRQAPGWSPLR